ncbi:hybrid sensor histidine kinase/response regulator [Stutzerimonas nosocomialis]|uniref:histidine kinase n=2 Tax=Stutzerimonas nosocomialis TaxID=1056496 RepID=A0A5R9QEC9_9GAMM|nr:hybrid sensor histidine kinase/response regulator [Stutzerimonas nosocomialis]
MAGNPMDQNAHTPLRTVRLRRRLLTIALAGIVPLALAAGLGLLAIIHEQRHQIELRGLEVTRLAATAIEVEVQRSMDVLQALAQSDPLTEGDIRAYGDLGRRMLPFMPGWQSILLIDRDGRVVQRVARETPTADGALADHASFAEVLRTGNARVGDMALGPRGQWGIPLRVPVVRGGQIRYVLTAVLQPQAILNVINNRRLPDGWVTTVLDRNEKRIARTLHHEETLGSSPTPTLHELLAHNPAAEGIGVSDTVEGESMFTAFVRLEELGWSIATGIPRSTLAAGTMQSLLLYGGGLAMSLALAVAAALFASRRINVPMRQLRRAASAIGKRQAVQAPASEIDEIREVGHALEIAAQARDLSEHERDQVVSRLEQAQRELTQQVSDLERLQALSSRLLQLPSLDEQLASILEVLCDLHGASQGLLSLSENGSQPRLHCARGLSQAALEWLDDLQPGPDICGGAVLSGQRIVAVETDPCFAPFVTQARQEGFRATHITPIKHSDGTVMGALTILLSTPREPSEREIRLADLTADLASVFIDRDRARTRAGALEQRLQVALDSSAVPFTVISPLHDDSGVIRDFRCDFVNPKAATILAYPVRKLTGTQVRDLLPDWGDSRLFATLVEVVTSGRSEEFELRSTFHEQERWFHVIATPFRSSVAVWFADFSDRKRQEQIILEADRRKDEFLATLAHELRNPLAPIRLAASVFGTPTASEAQKQRSQQVIERQVRHMALLLDDLMDISRITLGKLMLRREPVDLCKVVEAALETAGAKLEAKHHQVTVQLPDAPVMVNGDALRLEQLVTNLLTNAAKFTAEGGHIRVELRHEAGRAWVRVSDDGLGIDAEHLGLIFEKFAQVAPTHQSTGLGIGLALARGLAQLHGGDIEASSEGLGQGSQFTVHLPVLERQAPRPPERKAQALGSAGRSILVADDNHDIAETMAELLRLEGHQVHLAFDGIEALDVFQRIRPQVALLDIGMPGLRGDEVARAIRALPDGREVVLVAITGWGQPKDKEASLAAGFDCHLTKPVDLGELLAAIDLAPGAG